MAFKLLLSIFSFVTVCVTAHVDQSAGNEKYGNAVPQDKSNEQEVEVVRVDLYYESLCPDCIAEYPQLPPLVKKLGDQVDLRTYPYGNARIIDNGKTIVVRCQHGEAECYGNKLHACAIDLLHSVPAYVNFNACLMAARSNDNAADSCGQTLQIDSEAIKTCAKGERGFDLLVYYGRESEKVTYMGVPFVLVNGKELGDGETIWDAVCGAFRNPPRSCNKSDPDVKNV